MKKLGHWLYGTWHGAFCAAVVVTILLFALQMANGCLRDVVPWPKNLHIALMLAATANIGIAAVVSLCRRKWGQALGQFALGVLSFVGWIIVSFLVICVPSRMTTAPRGEWIESDICEPTAIPLEKLTFLGGMSQREPIVVFEVNGPTDASRFVPGSPWTGEDNAKAIARCRRIMEFCRIDIALPDDSEISRCNSERGFITVIAANGKRYLVYEGL